MDREGANEKRSRYCCYRLWAKLLRHRRSPYPRDGRFDFNDCLKTYIRNITMGDVVDADPPAGAIMIESESFVKFVVRHLDDAL